ncbi:MAG TPA: dihydroorotate dehydrogenase electron transfer subunit [Bacillota bacterium]|nr:dihydroorotate dehydrogenase electron transfer subunit [Bacillota bacterium]
MRSGVVLANEAIGGGYRHMAVNCPEIAKEVKDGQVVHIKVKDGNEPLLRRPFSVYLYDREAGTVEFVYAVKGAGTKIMAGYEPGDEIDLLGPTGKAYELKEGAKKIAILGRGVGIVSLVSLGVSAAGKGLRVEAILSGKTPDHVFGRKVLESSAAVVHEVYDADGSSDVENVRKILERSRQEGAIDQIFVCGSKRLGKLAYDFSQEHGIDGYISLEERMACGIGVCYVCVCKTTKGYQRVCKDGPVFPLAEVYG